MKKHLKFAHNTNVIKFDKIVRKDALPKMCWHDLRCAIKHMKQSRDMAELEFWYAEAEKDICTLKGFFAGNGDNVSFRYTLDLDLLVLNLKQKYSRNIKR